MNAIHYATYCSLCHAAACLNDEVLFTDEEEMNWLREGSNKMFTKAENLLLNMSSGLLPEYLSVEETEVLAAEFGDDWFNFLGYTEPEYKKPTVEILMVYN